MTSYKPVKLAFNYVEPEGCAKDKAPILFLHGMSDSKDMWRDIPKIIAEATKRKVYALDARDHGDSPWSDVLDFDWNVDDTLNFMDSINAPKVILIGHSMGGLTGIKMALRAPERMEKLVCEDISFRKVPQELIDPAIVFLSLKQSALEQVPDDVDEDTAKKIIFDFIVQGLPQEAKALMKLEIPNMRIELKRTSEGRWTFKTNNRLLIKGLKNFQELMKEPTGLYEGPVCFIYGKLSPHLVSLEEENLKKLFPNAKMVPIENAMHDIHVDHPKEFTNALLNFLLA